MAKKLICTVAVLLIALAGCGKPPSPTQPASGSIVETGTAPADTQHYATSTSPVSHNDAGGFSVYLVRQEISPERMMEVSLDQLELEETPILSIADIVAYTWETHEMELTRLAYGRIARLQGLVLGGLPFVVCVGSERVYGGAFWTSYSSAVFGGIVIDVYPAEKGHPIRIQLGYPSPEWFVGKDLRSDPRIFRSLEEAGRLR